MDKKEIWINQTMDSLDGATRAAANPLLYQQVKKRLETFQPKVVSIRPAIVWAAAASIALLLTINVLALSQYAHSKAIAKHGSESWKREYISDLNTISI